jgi:hypothetical protein
MGIVTHLKIIFNTHVFEAADHNSRVPGKVSDNWEAIRILRIFMLLPCDFLCYQLGTGFEVYHILPSDSGLIRKSHLSAVDQLHTNRVVHCVILLFGGIIFLWPFKIVWTSIRLPPLIISLWLGAVVLKAVDREYWKDHFKVFDYLKERKALSKRISGYLKEDSNFADGNIQTLSLPSDIWIELGRYLGVTDVVHISKMCKALHTVTQKMWDVQREKLGLVLKKGLSDKMLIKEEFCKVHLHCQKIFIYMFGVERILLMPCVNDLDLVTNNGLISRTANFKRFSVHCRFKNSVAKLTLLFGENFHSYGKGAEGSFPKMMEIAEHNSVLIFDYEKGIPALKTLITTGSAIFPWKDKHDRTTLERRTLELV